MWKKDSQENKLLLKLNLSFYHFDMDLCHSIILFFIKNRMIENKCANNENISELGHGDLVLALVL